MHLCSYRRPEIFESPCVCIFVHKVKYQFLVLSITLYDINAMLLIERSICLTSVEKKGQLFETMNPLRVVSGNGQHICYGCLL
jgi:hypothetical protein